MERTDFLTFALTPQILVNNQQILDVSETEPRRMVTLVKLS